MLLSISNPVAADSSISRDDFDVIDALMETLADRIQGGEPDVALSSAEGALAQVDANARGNYSNRSAFGIKFFLRWNLNA